TCTSHHDPSSRAKLPTARLPRTSVSRPSKPSAGAWACSSYRATSSSGVTSRERAGSVVVMRLWTARLVGCLVGAAVLLGAAAFRVVREGRPELAASEAAWAAGDLLAATVHARAAARAYVPFAPHVPLAYQRLRAVAQDCEARGDVESALFAWRAIRTAAIGS